jgi:hypothetical protein
MTPALRQLTFTAINTFVFLAALEFSLRFLRLTWLALFVSEGSSVVVGSLLTAWVYRQHFDLHPFLLIDPAVFSALFSLGLWLLRKQAS